MKQLIGHRGMRGLLPENTLCGLKYCIDHNLAGVEYDVQFNKDGTPYVYHDLQLNTIFTFQKRQRLPNDACIWFNSLTDENIAELDIGSIKINTTYRWRFWRQRCRQFEKIPSLEEWLSLENPNPEFIYLMEIKSTPLDWPNALSPQQQAELIAPYLLKHRNKNIIVESFDWRVIMALKEFFKNSAYSPTLCLLSYQQDDAGNNICDGKWTVPYNINDFDNIEGLIEETQTNYWAPFYKDIANKQFKTTNKSKLTIIPWTVNRQSIADNLLSNGCNYIISDYPLRC